MKNQRHRAFAMLMIDSSLTSSSLEQFHLSLFLFVLVPKAEQQEREQASFIFLKAQTKG